MSGSVSGPSVRDSDPWTVSAGVGGPDMLRVEVTGNVSDDVAIGADVGVGPLGISGGVLGMWYALKSPAHGHSLFLRGRGIVAPRSFADSGVEAPYLGIEAGLGWEWRSEHGPTVRVHGGVGMYGQPVPGGEGPFPGPALGIMVGWSF